MGEVFTLVDTATEYGNERFICSSADIFEIIDKILTSSIMVDSLKIYVTDMYKTVEYKEWRNEK